MKTLDGLPILKHYEALLASGKEKDAWAVMRKFFDFFGEDSPKEHLWFMLSMVLQCDNEEIESRHRSNMIFFYEYSSLMYKAAYTLYKKRKDASIRKRNKKK